MVNGVSKNKYQLGFSAHGLLAVLLVMLPNLLYLFFPPPTDPLASNGAAVLFWDVLENIGRFGLIVCLVFVRVGQGRPNTALWLRVVGIAALALYYLLWFFYFAGMANGVLLLGLAIFPTVFYLCTAMQGRNTPALLFTLLFGAVHIGITASNFLL